MPCKFDAKLLNENLEVIDNVKVRFEPKTQSVSFFDEELANSMFKIESTNIVFMNKNSNVDISTYIYINKLLYKIIKLNIYDTYLECLVYQCNNIPVNINDVFDNNNIFFLMLKFEISVELKDYLVYSSIVLFLLLLSVSSQF